MSTKKHQWLLYESPFSQIRDGNKDIEVRLYDEKLQSVEVGDEIEFTLDKSDGISLTRGVSKIEVFETFEELFSGHAPERYGLSNDMNLQEMSSNMDQYYSKELQAKFRKVSFHLVGTKIDKPI